MCSKEKNMPDTFSQLYIHIVFAVKGRKKLIERHWEEELYKYISGIVQEKGQKMIAINGMPDHIHLLIGMRPNCCLSELVREVKKSSNQFIKDRKFTTATFHWQEGFGAFSYSQSHLDRIVKYIANQKEHHKQRSFKQEYTGILNAFDVSFNAEYLFDDGDH